MISWGNIAARESAVCLDRKANLLVVNLLGDEVKTLVDVGCLIELVGVAGVITVLLPVILTLSVEQKLYKVCAGIDTIEE